MAQMDVDALEACIKARFPAFKSNKLQEILRLSVEIAKRDQLLPVEVIAKVPSGCKSYAAVKAYLLKLRFPQAHARKEKISEVFSAYASDPLWAVDLNRPLNVPLFKRIFIEESCVFSSLAMKASSLFPSAKVEQISSYKEYAFLNRMDTPGYNRRAEDLFIVKERYDFFKRCPCSPGVVPCGYHNVNLGFGCPFECSYCFLQDYSNAPGIVIPANLDDFLNAFEKYAPGVRVGSGETTDSLVYDHLTGFSSRIVDFFKKHPESVFEFKTKSDNISGLLSVKGITNVVVGFSLNPQEIIDAEEHFTASLEARLKAALACVSHGYRVAFHFDPVIYYPGWEVAYKGVVSQMFNLVPSESIAWISVGTLRMTQSQKKIIENRFPCNTILDGELFSAQDGKLRYAEGVRLDVYSKMIRWLKDGASRLTFIYLCMEMESVWLNLQELLNGSLKQKRT